MTTPLFDNGPFDNRPVILKEHSDWVTSVAFSSRYRVLASASYDGTIVSWNTTSGEGIGTMRGHGDAVLSIAFSPNGTTLASGSGDDSIKLWDISNRVEMRTVMLERHEGEVRSVSFSPDGARLASGSHDYTIRLWDIHSRTVSTLKGHSNPVNSVVFSPDGKLIASGSSGTTIRLWDITAGKTIATLDGHARSVLSVAFSPGGEYLASGSGDNTIRLWDSATGDHISTLKGHTSMVASVEFSPNGKYLVSGSYEDTIRIWDVASRTQISSLNCHSKGVESVTFSPSGTRLASGSRDGAARIWNATLQEIKAPQHVKFTSDLTGSAPSGSVDVSLQDTIAPGQISLSNDITGSVSLESSTPVGYGGFGELFLGMHKDHGKVALKKPRRLLNEALIRHFLREVNLWCSVSHPHVLPCLGMCRVGPNVFVVSPFIENGDLLSCINNGMDLNRSKLLYEVAEALAHLHHRGIVHGDVKAQNVLLSDNGSALLCDFGLAKMFDTMVTSTESNGAGSLRWMPPELFLGESRSMASDVYSLGITIAEVLSGRAPYHDIPESVAVMYYVVSRDGRPAKEPSRGPEGQLYATLWETAEKCWVKDVKARPHMAEVLGMLFPATRATA